MGGDGMGGLAVAIILAMVLMIVGASVIALLLGRRVARQRGASPAAVIKAGLFGSLIGVALGLSAVAATFFESSWSPPPRLEISVPPGYAQPWTILLEDPRAPTAIVWRGADFPFARRRARIAVPPAGVRRVKALGEAAGRGDLEILWSDGAPHNGTGGGPAPAGSGAHSYILLGRPLPDGILPQAPSGDSLAAEIKAREAGSSNGDDNLAKQGG